MHCMPGNSAVHNAWYAGKYGAVCMCLRAFSLQVSTCIQSAGVNMHSVCMCMHASSLQVSAFIQSAGVNMHPVYRCLHAFSLQVSE